MWRMEKRPYAKIAIESVKVAVARAGIAAGEYILDAYSLSLQLWRRNAGRWNISHDP